MTFEYFGFYMITAFGQTATTFASQNYGAGNRKRCAQILIRCMVAAILFGAFVILPLTVFRTQAAAAFSTDMRVVEVVFRNMQTLSSLFIVFPISWVVTAVFMWMAYLVIVTRN